MSRNIDPWLGLRFGSSLFTLRHAARHASLQPDRTGTTPPTDCGEYEILEATILPDLSKDFTTVSTKEPIFEKK